MTHHAPSLADRAASLSLGLLAAGNVVAVLAFLLGAFLLSTRAHAEEPACSGRDLLAAMEKDDPQALAKIRAEAAKEINGQGILWRIDKPGTTKPSFLFGTMHVADPRVTALSPAAEQAFDGAGTLVIETTDVLDQKKMMAAIMAEPGLMMFTDGSTLEQHLSKADEAVVEKGLDARGIPLASVSKMKPWILASVVALPACEMARKAAGAAVLDVKLAEEAKKDGKQVEGLETAVSQLRAMASLPLAFHMKGLVDTLKLGSKIDDVTETMVAIYESGETGLFWPFFDAVMPEEAGEAGKAGFEETMITARNRGMAESAVPILEKGGAFVAVGALHLAGPEGLVALLKAKGFSLTVVE